MLAIAAQYTAVKQLRLFNLQRVQGEVESGPSIGGLLVYAKSQLTTNRRESWPWLPKPDLAAFSCDIKTRSLSPTRAFLLVAVVG